MSPVDDTTPLPCRASPTLRALGCPRPTRFEVHPRHSAVRSLVELARRVGPSGALRTEGNAPSTFLPQVVGITHDRPTTSRVCAARRTLAAFTPPPIRRVASRPHSSDRATQTVSLFLSQAGRPAPRRRGGEGGSSPDGFSGEVVERQLVTPYHDELQPISRCCLDATPVGTGAPAADPFTVTPPSGIGNAPTLR